MILESVRNDVRRRTSALRAVLRVVETKEFAEAYAKATEEQQREVLKINTPRGIRDWLAKVTNRPLSQLSYRALRELAKQNHIPNYCRVEKDALIKQLESKGVNPDARKLEEGRDSDQRNEVLSDVGENPGEAVHNADDRPGEHAISDSAITLQ